MQTWQPAVLFKTNMCNNFANGHCQFGKHCRFAHSAEELRQKPDLGRTRMCKTMAESGICSDASCRFAHNMEQLRDGHFRSKMCRFSQQGRCKNGAKCHFAHSFEEKHQAYLEQQQQSIHGKEDGDMSTTASTSGWADIAAGDELEEDFLQPRTLDSACNADKPQQQQKQQQQSIHGMADGDVSPTASTWALPSDSPRGRWADIASEDEEEEEFLPPLALDSVRNFDKPQQQQQQQQSMPQLQLPTVAERGALQAQKRQRQRQQQRQQRRSLEMSCHGPFFYVVPVMPMMPFVPLNLDKEYVGPESELFKL